MALGPRKADPVGGPVPEPPLHSRTERRRDVTEEIDAEFKVVDRDSLVGRVDEARRQLRVHRPKREEAVYGRPEVRSQVVAVGEPGTHDRREPGARLDALYPRLERTSERCVDR